MLGLHQQPHLYLEMFLHYPVKDFQTAKLAYSGTKCLIYFLLLSIWKYYYGVFMTTSRSLKSHSLQDSSSS